MTVGHDDVLYAIRDGFLVRATDGLGVTWEAGVAEPATATYGFAESLHRTGTGWLLATSIKTSGSEQGSLFFTSGFNTAWTHVLTTTRAGAYFDELSCSSYYDAASGLDLVFAGEYGRGGTEKHILWMSTDGGQSFANKRETVNIDTTVNSHWHVATYDDVDGIVWAAAGDGTDNAKLEWSYDLGETWSTMTLVQPTSIFPLPGKVVFGIDAQWLDTGAFSIARADLPNPAGYTREFTITADAGPYQYGSRGVVDGDVAYMPFNRQIGTENDAIYATADGGRTFHKVYDVDAAIYNLVGPHNGYLFGTDATRQLVRAPLLEWRAA